MLGPIFDGAIDDWPHHLDKLHAFWSSVLLTSGRYKGQPMVAHVRHERHMTAENFDRWLGLWRRTTADLLAPEVAAVFQEKADRIAESLQLGVQFYRDRNVPRLRTFSMGRSLAPVRDWHTETPTPATQYSVVVSLILTAAAVLRGEYT